MGGIKSLEHRRFLLAEVEGLSVQSSIEGDRSSMKSMDPEVTQLTRSDVGHIRGQMRDCDCNITRLDQKTATVKKSLGIHVQPSTQFLEAKAKAKLEREEKQEQSKM